MKRWSGGFLGLAMLLVLAATGAGAAEAPKEAPAQAQVLHVIYYYLPG